MRNLIFQTPMNHLKFVLVYLLGSYIIQLHISQSRADYELLSRANNWTSTIRLRILELFKFIILYKKRFTFPDANDIRNI